MSVFIRPQLQKSFITSTTDGYIAILILAIYSNDIFPNGKSRFTAIFVKWNWVDTLTLVCSHNVGNSKTLQKSYF